MQRREFITLLAGAALIGPPTAIAQTPKVYRLGTLTAGPPMSSSRTLTIVFCCDATARGNLSTAVGCEDRLAIYQELHRP